MLIQDGRITAVGADVKVPRGARVINAKGKALLPGFFDVHTHWTAGGSPGTFPQIANAYVAVGVTTVNDFNEAPEAFAPLRAWLGQLNAPMSASPRASARPAAMAPTGPTRQPPSGSTPPPPARPRSKAWCPISRIW
ncbi:hypothetical protein ACFSUK_31680 [Sphingobium scionense]